MISIVCAHQNRKVHGKTKAGAVRYKCKDCGKTFTASTELFAGMRIGLDRAVQIIELLCEGMAVRSVARVTDTDPHTIIDLLLLVGERCDRYMAEHIRGVHVDDVQIDEIWQYVFCKAATAERKKYIGGCGDSYTYTAIERHTKLLVCWHFGRRDMSDSHAFARKLNAATTGRFHLSSDGWGAYPQAVTWNLGGRVDFGQLIKTFTNPSGYERRRYSPGKIIRATKRQVLGNPEPSRICTSHAERMNGSIRHYIKRMTRLTCAFSKRWTNHRAALGLFFAHYNYCRTHKTLKGMTPAMAHGLTTEVWTIRDLLQRIAD